MLENIEILNLSQQKEEKTILCQYQIYKRKFISNRNVKNRDTYE